MPQTRPRSRLVAAAQGPPSGDGPIFAFAARIGV